MSAPAAALDALTTEAGVYCVLALDHRDAMRNAFRRAGVEDPSQEEMTATKCRIVTAVGDHISGILLDEHAARSCAPPGIGVVLPLEEQGHESLDGGRLNRLTADFGPAEARSLGAAACKLLLHYRPDHAPTAARQRELAEAAARASHEEGLPLVLEPLLYRLEHEDEHRYRERFAGLVVAAARDLASTGTDLLKLQFPAGVDEAADCARLSEAAAPLAWVLLGGSEVDGDVFAAQLALACDAGCAGFIAGRAVWAGVLGLPAAEQARLLAATAVPLLDRLRAVAHGGPPCAA